MDSILNVTQDLLSTPYATIGISILIVIITIITLWILKSSTSSKRNSILILGNPDSGKTLLFAELVYKKKVSSLTSIQENKGLIASEKSKRKFELIDIPGYSNIRNQVIDKYRKSTKYLMETCNFFKKRGIIFVIDSTTFNKDYKDVALFLNEILTDSVLTKLGNTSILIACNKQDFDLAKAQTLIKQTLEKEIDILRKTSSASLASTSDKGDRLGNLNDTKNKEAFEFKNVKKFKIDFCECSALKSDDLVCIQNWIDRLK